MWWQTFLPIKEGYPVNFSIRILGTLIVAGVLITAAGLLLRRRSLLWLGTGWVLCVGGFWSVLWTNQPNWLRRARALPVPHPDMAAPSWTTRAPGLETAEVDLSVENRWVDRLALVRLDPSGFCLRVHVDPEGRSIEEWQRATGASVVINGSYFSEDGKPVTPLRSGGRWLGPRSYRSRHGAIASDGRIVDLAGKDLFATLDGYADAMVSYPLLLDQASNTRAVDSPDWLAARSFVATDASDRVILGTTRTGFFTLRRLAEFLRLAPLEIRTALNFDGGPIAQQLVKAGGYRRLAWGIAELSDRSDVFRAFWQESRSERFDLPIVFSATPREDCPPDGEHDAGTEDARARR